MVGRHVPEVEVTLVESGVTADNLGRLDREKVPFALMSIAVIYEVLNGLEDRKDKTIPDLRLLWPYILLPYEMVVREDSGVTSIYKLTGKKFCAGGQSTAGEARTMAAFELFGIKRDWYVVSTKDAIEAVKNRKIVGSKGELLRVCTIGKSP